MLVVTTAHSNIPTTSQSDQELTKNHTGSQEPAVVRLPAGPSTSSLLQVKANGKSPTIATPSITALRQSRPPFKPEFQAAVTNGRPVGTGEKALNAPPAFTALRSPCLAGSFEGIASVEAVDLATKPPLGKEITVRLPECKSPVLSQGALGPKPVYAKKIEDKPELSKCPRPVANACRDAGRLEDGGTPKETRDLPTTMAGSKDSVEGDLLANGEKLEAIGRSAIPTQPVASLRGDAFEKRTSRSTTDHQVAVGQEAASAQAVYRGRKVTMSEVSDQDDNTSFMMNMKSKLTTPLDLDATVTSPMVVEPSQVDATAKEVPQLSRAYTSGETYHEWLKPFRAEWTLHGIVQAKTESEAKAILKNWIHKARAEEVVDDMIEGMRRAMRVDALWWLEELRQPKRYISALSGKGKNLTIDVQIETLTDTSKITTTALIDSGCTSSAINRAFVKKHNIPTYATAAPIPVYNADGTRNQGGSITHYAEIRLVIGNHTERIDLAITELGDRQIFLGHDWLARHNPIINWKLGRLTFARCQCQGILFALPDTDPDDKWDEELEEGDTILAIDFTQAILIRAHHANDLAAKASEGKETKTFEEMVPEWCRDFADLFEKGNFDKLPEPKTWDHAIELIPNANANLDCKVYPLNRNEQAELDKFLDENLSSGRIRPSKSPMASPFFFIKKKDGKLRPVQDYRKLNEMMIKNRYPLPLISELMDKLRGAKYFTKCDVRWGYNNVRIKSGDEWKAVFRTNRGLFKPTVMFFGLTNSPATFQWMMNDIFKDLIASVAVTVYLDDILIMSKTKVEHRRITREVLKILRQNKLFLKAEKCEFETLETEYLGVIISEGSIQMDPIKIAGIAAWPVPTKKVQLQSFLGFTNFYRRFIKGYSKVVKPMTQLTGNDPWTWGKSQQDAFEELKRLLAKEVVLAIPTETGKFRVEADASEGAIGAVLSQEQDGKWRPVAFLSKSLTVTERNYEIYDKELLAIMLALDEWRHYLIGETQDFEIWTDH